MEIQRTPVTLDQRIEYLKQATTNVEMNKKSFPWVAVIISLIAGAGIYFAATYFKKKRKNKKDDR